MTELNTDKFLNEINKKWINKNCPMCGQNHWNIDKNMMSPMKLGNKGDIQLGGQIMPLVAVSCLNCGNVIFVNPLIIGAVDSDSQNE